MTIITFILNDKVYRRLYPLPLIVALKRLESMFPDAKIKIIKYKPKLFKQKIINKIG